MAEISLQCNHCGQTIRASDEESLVREMREHNKSIHKLDTPEREIRQRLKEGK